MGRTCQESFAERGELAALVIPSGSVKSFTARDVLEWVAELLCRTGNEPMIDRNPYSRDGLRRAIWNGRMRCVCFENMVGKDCLCRMPTQIELLREDVFAFCWDDFNPVGTNRRARR